MKKYLSEIIAVIIILLILLSAYLAIKNAISHFQTERSLNEIISHQTDSVSYYKDIYHREHARVAQLDINYRAADDAYKSLLDSIEKMEHVKKKNIQAIINVKSFDAGNVNIGLRHDTVLVFIKEHSGKDSIEKISATDFNYSDSFLSMKGSIDTMLHLKYFINVDIQLTRIVKRNWFLGRRHYFIDGYSTNPNIHINGLKDIEISKRGLFH
jgi:hypothetical protein